MRSLLTTLIGLGLCGAAFAQPLPPAGLPAAVFTEKQPITLAVAAGQRAIIRDAADGAVTTVDGAAEGRATLRPLRPGYYEAEIAGVRYPFAVVIDPARRVKAASRLATDNAMSWLVKPEQFEGVAEMLRLAGIGWVRERLSWADVEPAPGAFRWGRYDAAADALAKRGIKVYSVFHATPPWSRADHDTAAPCDDLRDIHRFAYELGKHFAGRIQAWEVWNEPDISFMSQPAADLAGFQKAAFLGFRAADPTVLVLGPSMAMPAGAFSRNLFSNGLAGYMDVWNYHIYADPATYADRTRAFRRQLPAEARGIPFWVTEAGDRVDGPNGVLTAEARRHQAAFLSRAYPLALAGGIDRHFWFVFPFYKEGTTGWGLFEPDQKVPFPAYAAMSTSTYAMGAGDFLASLPMPAGAHALAFGRGDGTVGVAVWRDNDAVEPVPVPVDRTTLTECLTHLGTPVPLPSGPAAVPASRAVTWLILSRAPAGVARPASPLPRRAPRPGPLVARLRITGAAVDKGADRYVLQAGAQLAAQAEMYNFGTKPLPVRVELANPPGWGGRLSAAKAILAPNGRTVLPVRLRAPKSYATGELVLSVRAAGAVRDAARVAVSVDPNTAEARQAVDLPVNHPEGWNTNIAGHGTLGIGSAEGGGVRFAVHFGPVGDNWAYPEFRFAPPMAMSAFTAIRFDYRTTPTDVGVVRLMLVDQRGGSFLTAEGFPGSAGWRTVTVPISSLAAMAAAPAGDGQALDAAHVAVLRIGVNARPSDCTLEVRNVRLVKL